jgi:hypothetical protein
MPRMRAVFSVTRGVARRNRRGVPCPSGHAVMVTGSRLDRRMHGADAEIANMRVQAGGDWVG